MRSHVRRLDDLHVAEEGVRESGLGGDALVRFVDEQLGEKVEALLVELRVVDGELLSRPARKRALVVGQLADAGPGALVGRAEDAKDLKELIDLRVAAKEHLVRGHLGEDARYAPYVDLGRVVLAAE